MKGGKRQANNFLCKTSIESLDTQYYGNTELGEFSFLILEESQVPVFVDSHFRSYNKNYDYLCDYPKEASSFDESDSVANNGSTAIYSYLRFPEPSRYLNKEEYLHGCSRWKKNVNNIFGYIIPPIPRISFNYLLKKSILLRKGDKNYRTFKPEKEPLVAQNQMHLRGIVFDGESFLPDDPFDYQLANRNVVRMKDQITDDPQWESELLPMEIYPFMYDSYEEFEESYVKWNNIVNMEIKNKMKSFDEIEQQCGLQRTQKVNRSDSLIKDILIKKQKEIFIASRDYSWTKNLHNVTEIDALITFINEAKNINLISENYKSNDDYFVINKYKGSFVNEFMEYGSTKLSVNKFNVFRYSHRMDLRQNIISAFKTNSLFVQSILSIPYSLNDIKKVFMEGKIEKEISFAQIKNMLTYSKCSNETSLRFVFLLISILNNNFTKEYSLVLDLPENIHLLYEITKRILSIETLNINIIEPIETNNIFNIQLCLFHYFSSLLFSQLFDRSSVFYNYLMLKCRDLSRFLIKTIKNDKDFRTKLWNSLYKEEITDEYKILLMIVTGSSDELKRVLLNPDFFIYGTEISKFKLGKRFLRIVVSFDSIVLGNILFLINYKYISLLLKNSNLYFTYILREIFWSINNNIKKIGFQYDALIQLFIDSANINLYGFIKFLEPLSLILTHESTDIHNKENYQSQLSALLSIILNQIHITDDLNSLIQILIPFTKFDCCNQAFASSNTFCGIVCNNLYSMDEKISSLNWKILFKVCKYPKSSQIFLNCNQFLPAIHILFINSDPISIRKFFKFLTKQLSFNNNEITQKIMEICKNIIGKLACLFVAVNKKFSKYVQTTKQIHNFLKLLGKSQDETVNLFVTQLCNHLNSNGNEGILLIKNYFK